MPDVESQEDRETLKAKIDALPPALFDEVEDFVDFVLVKRAPPESTESRPMRLSWRGALRDLKGEYTAEELRQEALEQWKKTADLHA